MDVETSLCWRGPYWYAGRRPKRSTNGDTPEDLDVSLVNMFDRGIRPPTALPAAIVVDVECFDENQLEPFFKWLLPLIADIECEVPFYVLTGGDDILPEGLQATAIINRCVPEDVLLMLICIHQRSLLRAEEAQIRRTVFGRIPEFGSAPHHTGTSSLMVVGLSGRFLEWQDASDQKVEVVGAFDGNLAVEFMSKRAFDAVVIDAPFEDAVDYMQQIRRDSRFAGLPVLAVCESQEDSVHLFRNGASDVLVGENRKETLARRLKSAIRFGKRRRLADRLLAESHVWLRERFKDGGLGADLYTSYLETCSNAFVVRGLDLWEMRLQPENFGIRAPSSAIDLEEINETLLAVADATSRDEDFVCLVRGMGPVAVLKNEAGTRRLQKRINSILSNTVL